MGDLQEKFDTASSDVKASGLVWWDRIRSKGSHVASKLSGAAHKVTNVFAPVKDNVVIPVNTKTLIGDDFSSLYESSAQTLYRTESGVSMDVISSDSSYETAMHSMGLSFSEPKMYSDLDPESQAAYEITLLSKKYANMYTGNDEADMPVMDEYADKMVQYREYCERNGLSFVDVIGRVSSELQTETKDYLTEDEKLLSDDSWTTTDRYRVISNRAHNWAVKCGEQAGYEDNLVPAFEGKISLEDTQNEVLQYTDDIVGKAVSNVGNFLTRLAAAFKKKWQSVVNSWKVVTGSAKDIAEGVADRYDADMTAVGDNSMTIATMSSAVAEGIASGRAGEPDAADDAMSGSRYEETVSELSEVASNTLAEQMSQADAQQDTVCDGP